MRGRGDSGPRGRLWTPVFIGIVALTLCCFTVGQGTNSGTSVYLAQRGATATLAGIGAAAFSVAAAVARIVSGPLADRRGRMVVVGVGAVVLTCGTLGAAAFPDLDLLVLWRSLQGIGFSAATTAAATAAADVLPAERLGEGIGYYGLGQAVAMSFGPALALFLVATEPPENLFWGLGVPAAAVLVIALFCRYEKDVSRLPETSTYRQLAERRGVGSIVDDNGNGRGGDGASAARVLDTIFEPGALAGALPMMVMAPTFGFGIYFTGLYGTSLGVPAAGAFYTVSAVAMIAVRLASRSFMDRLPAFRLHVFAAAAGVAFCAALVAAGQPGLDAGVRDGVYYLAGAFYGLCLGMALPVNQAVAVKNSPAERWGAANGLFLLLSDLGIGAAAVGWGATSDALGFAPTLAIVAAFIVASVIAAWLAYPSSDRRWRA